MSIAQYVDLIICPAHIAEAAKASRMGLPILINQRAFLESFSLQDAAYMKAFNNHAAIARIFGEKGCNFDYRWGIQSEAEHQQYSAIRQMSQSPAFAKEIEDQYIQEPTASSTGKLFEVEDLGNGTVVLIVKPGALYAMRNDNYLMTVLSAVVGRMFVFMPLDKLLQYAGSSGEVIKRYFNLAAFTNKNRPPQPVFA